MKRCTSLVYRAALLGIPEDSSNFVEIHVQAILMGWEFVR